MTTLPTITTEEAAELAACHPESVRRWCRDGKVEAQLLNVQSCAIDRESLKAFLASRAGQETGLYSSREAAAYVRERGVLADRKTIWVIARRYGIDPRPNGNRKALGMTQEQLDQLVEVYRPPANVPSASMPQRAPQTVHPNIFVINEDTSRNRPRLAPKLQQTVIAAQRKMLAHRAEVVERVARTGETAFEASMAIRQGF